MINLDYVSPGQNATKTLRFCYRGGMPIPAVDIYEFKVEKKGAGGKDVFEAKCADPNMLIPDVVISQLTLDGFTVAGVKPAKKTKPNPIGTIRTADGKLSPEADNSPGVRKIKGPSPVKGGAHMPGQPLRRS